MNLHQRILVFVHLGKILRAYTNQSLQNDEIKPLLDEAVAEACEANSWFTAASINQALEAIGNQMLLPSRIEPWASAYSRLLLTISPAIRIGIVMAGNLPLVGFHDLLCVLLCGYKAVIKPASKDTALLKAVCRLLCDIEPRFGQLIEFTGQQPTGVNAAIATGSNNSARYFQSWYSGIPHIIRHNRSSLAVLTGNETDEELTLLGKDIFSYYGLGCRNVSALFVPRNYNFDKLLAGLSVYSPVLELRNYCDCYRYQKAVMTLSGENFIDNGFALLSGKAELYSPISVINYQFYDSLADVEQFILFNADTLQCVVSAKGVLNNTVYFGDAQNPALNDYADNIDTMDFLLTLK